jgi:hypothetical protein
MCQLLKSGFTFRRLVKGAEIFATVTLLTGLQVRTRDVRHTGGFN